MSDSIFFRAVKQEVIDEIVKRYEEKTVIRTEVESPFTTDSSGRQIYKDNPQTSCFTHIYDDQPNPNGGTGNLILASGDTDIIDQCIKFPDGKVASIFDGMEVSIGQTYGSLRSVKFQFRISKRQPIVLSQAVEWDQVFSQFERAFSVGRKIVVQYGYGIPGGTSDSANRRGADLSGDFVPEVHRSPGVSNGGQSIDDNPNSPHGYVFSITRPNFSLRSNGEAQFEVEGIGVGGECLAKPILPFGANSFNGYKRWHVDGTNLYGWDANLKDQNAQEFPYFICDFDLDKEEGRYLRVNNIVDWIDFDIQSHLIYSGEIDADEDETEADNGASFLNSNDKYLVPEVERGYEAEVAARSGRRPSFGRYRDRYKSVGWVILKFEDDEFYSSDYAINSNDDERFTYYVTLEYLCWLFNWTLNVRYDDLAANAGNMRRKQFKEQAKKSKQQQANEGASGQSSSRNAPIKDVLRYIIRCDKNITKADTMRVFGDGGSIADKKRPIPSADPLATLFFYGSGLRDDNYTGNYACLQKTTNWWGVLGAAAVFVGTAIVTGGVSIIAFAAAAVVASKYGQSDEREDVICMSNPTKESDEQLHPLFGSTGTNMNSYQDQWDIRQDLSKLLINRDIIAAITDELGGLTRTDSSTKEGAAAKVSDVVSNVETTNTNFTVEKFFNKLFTIIKTASGGALDLYLTPDPDETDPYTSALLITNRVEPAEEKVKYPVFQRADGSVIDLQVKSKITKAQQLEAAYGKSSQQGDLEGVTNSKGNEDTTEESEDGATNIKSIDDAKDALTKSAFSAENKSILSQMLTNLDQSQSIVSSTKQKMKILNLELDLVIQGIEGFKFGDTFSTSMLPPAYRMNTNQELTADGILKPKANAPEFATRVCFTTTSVTQRIFAKRGWSTSLKGIMRFVPENKSIPLSYTNQMRG